MHWARLICTVGLFSWGAAAAAQDHPNTILVMDGSGSMWGQIDGIAKITIAQDVMGDLLDSLPDDQSLGLIAYGHRERGNCTDIEVLIAPGAAQRDTIESAVNGISPLGKTPMTDAVIAAAEALRYTEDSATVILVSDGVETCNPDPCAAARILEETGVDFTAHVIGFDVGGDAEATAQMQCIAAETGGMFIPAADAGELAAALTTVVEDPEPVTLPMTFTAVIGDDKRPLDGPVQWTLRAGDAALVSDMAGNPFEYAMEEGAYQAEAYAVALEQTGTVDFVVVDGGSTAVAVAFEEPALTARILAPATIPGGAPLPVGWDGPNDERDNIQIFATGDNARMYEYIYTETGNPVEFIAPFHAGTYELRYLHQDQDIIGTALFEVTEVPVGLDAPSEVPVGSTFPVVWTGPDAPRDNVQIGPVGEARYTSYSYTDAGPEVTLTAPAEPGDYELRYSFRDREIVYTQPITVTQVQATVTAPSEAVAGSTIAVDWTGPGYDRDYIGIGAVGATSSAAWQNFTYISEGAPLSLLVPITPGDYQISYFLGDERTVLVTEPITVLPVSASVTAPAEALGGSEIPVSWTGPDYDGDYIGIGKADAESSRQWENFTYTREGETLSLLVPTEPGDYVIRYFAAQDRTPIAATKISVTTAEVSLTAPDTAIAGDTIAVDWSGPDFRNDYIGIGQAGATNSAQWENFAYTRDGTPLPLLIPTTPGDYTISYFSGQDRSIQASTSITVSEATAQVTAPETAPAGATIDVDWTGPDYRNDYIGIGAAGATGSAQWENFAYTRDGAPAAVLMPTEPGDYVISYFSGQDRSVLASTKIVIAALTTTVTAPATAVAGSTITVDWDGPDYARDYIGIGKVGASGNGQWENFAYTADGAPSSVLVPMTPGDYVVSYFSGQDRSVMATAPITVSEVTATITAPATAIAGDTIAVDWTGPDYDRDYIGIGMAGASGNAQWQNFVYTDAADGTLLVPTTPGDYLISYFSGQDRSVLKSVPIRVDPIKSVKLLAAETAPAGGEIVVGWDGPAYERDYIGIGKVGADGNRLWERYTAVSSGNPVTLSVPDEPGDYLITYFLGQDRSAVAAIPVTVE